MSEDTKRYADKMEGAMQHLRKELAAIRAGRANPAILDKVSVDYYGTPTPVGQVATVAVSEARVLTISPWDTSLMKAIEKAVYASDIGITPTNDGKVMRLVFPAPTEERRKQLVKEAQHLGEETKIAVRNVRREAMEKFKAAKKNGDLTEDDLSNIEEEMQKVTDKYIKETDKICEEKTKEIMEI